MATTDTAGDLVNAALRPTFRGTLITPPEYAYDEARKVYNGMIDRRPALIARCADVADVIAAVGLAREHGAAARGARRRAQRGRPRGRATARLHRPVAHARRARRRRDEAPSASRAARRWGDVDHATHAFGLAVPSGIIAHHRRRRPDPRRRARLPLTPLRPVDRQPAVGRPRPRRRQRRHRERRRARRPVLGRARRRRQLRRRDLVRVPGRPVHTVVGRPDALAARARRPRCCAGTTDFMASAPDDLYGFFAFLTVPPADAFPRGAARAEDVRRRVVLHRRRRAGRRGPRAGARASARPRSTASADAVPDAQRRVRRALPAGAAVVLEGRLRR